MAEADDPTQQRNRPARQRGDASKAARQAKGAAGGGDRRRGPPLQVDVEANRITATFPGPATARPESTGPAASGKRKPNAAARPNAARGATHRPGAAQRPSAQTGGTQARRSDDRETRTDALGAPAYTEIDLDDDVEPAYSERIPTFALDPHEPAPDIEANVYIASEHGERRRGPGKKQGKNQRGKRRAVTNPFGQIEKGPRPKGHARIPTWQKILMGICAIAVLGVAYIVFGTGSTKLPGWDQGVLVRTQIEFLDQQIELPYVPQSVTWQILTQEEQERYGATKLRVIAVIEFTPEQAAELIARSTSMPQLPGAEEIESHRWFPDEARELMSDLDVDSDTTVYGADVFYDGVFRRGTMLRLGDSGYIVTKLFDY
ncbi:MAG: hypothetical protein SGJ07_09895 [Rhodospirillaceae bacterium]|nr:hypothetical protein [Rhodospirillaceae bacterium]